MGQTVLSLTFLIYQMEITRSFVLLTSFNYEERLEWATYVKTLQDYS